jgi:hypothetical protein
MNANRLLTIVPVLTGPLLTASPALAQATPRAPDESGWIAVVISIVLIIAVAVASFMSSKRTHQD